MEIPFCKNIDLLCKNIGLKSLYIFYNFGYLLPCRGFYASIHILTEKAHRCNVPGEVNLKMILIAKL